MVFERQGFWMYDMYGEQKLVQIGTDGVLRIQSQDGKVTKYYAKDKNVVNGRVHFESSKIAVVPFIDEGGNPVTFAKKPKIQVAIADTTNSPACVTSINKEGNVFVSCTIEFQTNQTTDVDWEVKE